MKLTLDNRKKLREEIKQHCISIKVPDANRVYFANVTDIHVGHKGFDLEALEGLVEVVKNTPNFYIHIGGDASNHANKGSRSSQFEENMTPREQIKGQFEGGKLVRKGLIQIFEPIRDRIVGITDGNHNTTRLKEFNDMSSAEYFADLFGIPYLGEIALIEFVVGKRKHSYLHFIHHSGSTGKKKNLNALQDRALNWEADVHWGEHTHKDHFGRDTVIKFDRKNKTPYIRDRLYINGNSYLSWSGYAKAKLYAPNTTGARIVEMSGGAEWDIRVFERVRDFVDLVYQK